MLDPKDLYTKALDAAEDYADKDYAAGILEDALDAMRGDIIAELKSKGESVTLIPALSKSDQRYKEASQEWRTARREAVISKLKYDQVCRFQDNVRTNEATARKLAM